MPRTFVGFGFGAIQAGLFLAEAYLSHNFDRLVVAEVLPDVVAAVRAAGSFTVNIAHPDRVEALVVGPIDIYNPQISEDRSRLVAAVAAASEMATALPSVDLYSGGNPAASVAGILAEGLRRKAAAGPLAVIYTAENNTHAAEILRRAVLERTPATEQGGVLHVVQFLDTIIGKMSGAPDEVAGLAPITPGLQRAFLVEAFNRILIDQVERPTASGVDQDRSRQVSAPGTLDEGWTEYRRGIKVFVEKPDLRPFAEAKLYGHNAGHALAAYLAHQLGFTRIEQLTGRPDILQFVRNSMLQESGVPLCRRFTGSDPLFTPEGFRHYVDDLIVRMVNPYVRDTVARVGRDPSRKLGWDDRLVGAMRLAAAAGIQPSGYALGAAAALEWLGIAEQEAPAFLQQVWSPARPDAAEAGALVDEIARAQVQLQRWRAYGYPQMETAGRNK